jgi:outer membrane protein
MRSFVRWIMMAPAMALLAGASSLAAQTPPPPPPKPQPAAATPAQAAPTPSGNFRVAFVNAQALLRGMPGFAKAESLWTKDAEVADAEMRKLQAAFDSAVAQYQQSQAMMTPSNRSAKEKQLQAQQDSTQAKVNQIRERVNAKERELMAPMQDRLRAVIDGIRAEGNFAMIIDIGSQVSQNIIAYDKSLDITLRVAQRLASSN